MANDVELSVGLDASAVNKSLNKLKSSLIKVGAAAVAAFASKKVIDAAIQQEKAINALNQALIRSGDFSKEASEDLQQFASDLQDVTTIGDEATLELLALAKSFGVSNEEAKKLVTTAADASVALGVDTRTALEQLGGTLSGTQGRLAKFVPEVKELGQEALKNGAAIDIFAEKFKGAAQGELNTFSGAVTQLSNTMGDFAEEIGFFITQSPLVISAIKGAKDIFAGFINFLKNNGGDIREGFGRAIGFLITGFGTLAKNVIPPLIEVFLVLFKVLDAVSAGAYDAVEAFAGFDLVKRSVTFLTRSVLALADAILENLLGAFKDLARFVGVEIPSIDRAITGIREKIESLATVDTGQALSEFVSKAGDVRDAVSAVVEQTLLDIQNSADKIDFEELGEKISKGLQGKISITPESNTAKVEQSLLDSIKVFSAKFDETLRSNFEANIGQAAKDFGTAAVNSLVSGFKKTSEIQNTVKDLELQLEQATSLEERKKIEADINKAQKELIQVQKDSAFELTRDLSGSIADAFLPGAGQFVTALLEFARDPEAFRTFIEGFVKALPEVIEGLAEALPEVLIVLAENLDKIFVAIVRGAVVLFGKLFEAQLNILGMLLENAGREFGNLIRAVGQDFIGEILKGASQFIQKIIEGVQGAFGGGTTGKLASGDVGGFVTDITKAVTNPIGAAADVLGFADGGIIPPGFDNDTGIAKVSSGEMVLNDRQQQNLFKLLDGGGLSGGTMLTVNLVMNEEILAQQILEINRDNLRTA